MPDAMKYSQRETFFWLKNAALLDCAGVIMDRLHRLAPGLREKISAAETPNELLAILKEMPAGNTGKKISRAIAAHPAEIRDYWEVRRSADTARKILTSLCRRDVSIGDLDKIRKEKKQFPQGGFLGDVKKRGLRTIQTTGRVNSYYARLAIEAAGFRLLWTQALQCSKNAPDRSAAKEHERPRKRTA